MSLFPTTLPEPDFTPLRGGPVLRWGVLAPGRIAGGFVWALHHHTGQRVHAVASRDLERARGFAAKYGVPRAYGSYEELVADPGIDIVYVASPHSEHKRQALLAIAAGKHVLVEKPLALNAAEAREIAGAARAARVFAMEAMWSRFFPRTALLGRLLRDGVLGDIRLVTADFGGRFDFDPEGRIFNPALGGGALLDIGIYPIWFAHFVLGAPTRVLATGELAQTGVDGQSALVLSTDTNAQALLHTTLFANTPIQAAVSGTLARIHVDAPFIAPGGFTLISHTSDARLHWNDSSDVRESEGLAYQASAVAQHIADGLTESPLHPLDFTIAVLETIDTARRQVGYPP
ncbi:Gfo/Idh/MocA family oxidoreductase [Stigmatella sp. ncwal1]|uniref:Gfo/Idh/MocA family oxidoreductase n=1 Tax=Stigmatella ashevillensis TaxID=2995309 RepID=A0ABT5D0G8_9BACT|nr:Gfo/Idh/MocA family oxidoreductase [Stigmatella ashevillena]MDC0707164.1 Gfo/Idh/MocA family oxidoreductase [Stigmatella ashevillena]